MRVFICLILFSCSNPYTYKCLESIEYFSYECEDKTYYVTKKINKCIMSNENLYYLPEGCCIEEKYRGVKIETTIVQNRTINISHIEDIIKSKLLIIFYLSNHREIHVSSQEHIINLIWDNLNETLAMLKSFNEFKVN